VSEHQPFSLTAVNSGQDPNRLTGLFEVLVIPCQNVFHFSIDIKVCRIQKHFDPVKVGWFVSAITFKKLQRAWKLLKKLLLFVPFGVTNPPIDIANEICFLFLANLIVANANLVKHFQEIRIALLLLLNMLAHSNVSLIARYYFIPKAILGQNLQPFK
jgi:hypothetical protein